MSVAARRSGPLRRLVARLAGGEEGFVLVFAAVAIPALVGLVALAVDGVRLMVLDTQLAAMADAAALAAAERLDRSPGALPEARAAAEALLNGAAFSRRNPDTPRLTFRFAASLADLRADPAFGLDDAAGASATHVEVTTGAYSLTASLMRALGSPIQRRAIAAVRYYACDVTPLAMCHTDPDAFAAQARPGRQYYLHMDGNIANGSLVALDRPDEREARTTLRNLASDAPAFCYGDGVALRRTIAAPDFDSVVNIRFDQYHTAVAATDPEVAAFPPAPNVVQGRRVQSCVSPPTGGDVNPPFHLPRDSVYETVRPPLTYDLGQGNWHATATPGTLGEGATPARAVDAYILWNHADKDRGFQDRLRAAPTRWDLYLAELGLTAETEMRPVTTAGNALAGRTMPTGGPLSGPFASLRERAVPACYLGTRPATQARRRILYATIADCRDFESTATAARLSRHVAKFFLTEAAAGGNVFVELVRMLEPRHDDDKLRRVVELVEIR